MDNTNNDNLAAPEKTVSSSTRRFFKPTMTHFKILSGVFLGTIVVEHIGRKFETEKRPSIILNKIADESKIAFKKLGTGFAWLSSYLTLADIKDIAISVHDVVKPSIELTTSPFYSVYGYIKKADTYGNKNWMIYTGSGLGVGLSVFGYYKLSKRYPSMNFIAPAFVKIRQTLKM